MFFNENFYFVDAIYLLPLILLGFRKIKKTIKSIYFTLKALKRKYTQFIGVNITNYRLKKQEVMKKYFKNENYKCKKKQHQYFMLNIV